MRPKPIGKTRMVSAKFFAVLFFCVLASCDTPDDTRPIRLSANSWVGYEPFFVAESKEFFPEGSVHLIETPFSLTLEQALRGGTIDASALSLSRAFSLLSDGFDITIVLVLDWSDGADKLIAKPDIKTVTDLKGQRIGAEPRTVNTYLLLRALQEFSLEPSDVTIVPLITEDLNDSYKSGDIVAASLFGPEATQMLESGGHTIFDSSMIPGEILDVLVVRTPYLNAHPSRVGDMIKGWIEAVDYLNNIPSGEKRATGLLTEIEYDTSVTGIRFAALEDNRSFLEANGTRLQAVLNARQHYRRAMATSLRMEKMPPIDPRPFFKVINERGE